jgi:hypothetical protein
MENTPNSGQPTGVGGGYEDVLSGASSSGAPSSAPPTISNAANAAVASSQQPGMTTPPPQPAAAPPPPPKQSALSQILHAVGNALGGGETEKFVNKQTGAIEERPRSTGSKIGSAISTIAMGAAAGASQHGPGSVGRSALAGGQVVQEAQDRRNQQLQAESQNVRETNDAQQRALLTQASLAKSNQEMARMSFDLRRSGLDFSKEQADVANEMASIKGIPGATMLGHFKTNDDLNSYLQQAGPQQSQQHAKDFAANLIRVVPNATGGFDAYQVPKGWDQQTIGPGHTASIMTTQLGKGGKPEPVWRTIPAPEDMTWGNFLQWQGQTLKASTDIDLNQANLAEKKAATGKDIADTAHEKAETALTNLNIKDKEQWLGLTQSGDLFGDPIGSDVGSRTEYNKRVDSFSKDYGKDLNQLDQASSQLNGIIANAQKTGKLPGADSVVGLFDAIGISSAPLKGKGFRISGEIVGEHRGARNVLQDAATKLQKYSPEGTGQVVTLQQLQDYSRILNSARHDAYVGAADQSRQQGIGVRVVPQGHNTAADANTVKLFLDLAGGNPQKATKALQTSGWQVAP